MADIAIFRINYKSDFILTLQSDAGWLIPFCIKFWTGAPSKAYYAYYDGMNYTNCAPVEGEPTKLMVQFDDHHLPIGDLKFQIGYHFTVDDFPTSVEDEVLNQASVIIEVDDAPAQVMLDLNGETAPEIEFSLPAYTNEQQRIANEEQRIAAESIRIVNEESRIAAETTRQQNEAQRISNEESRVVEFARLNQESETAIADANAAATLANEKAALAADKAALAQASATIANEKAQLAADKAALAQAAATLANDKADLAQQKAAYAQAQGDYAKGQGDTAQADHVRAESDHTRAESDHAAVEMYVDSLGAFDISAYHATGSVLAKYADLAAALGTNGANIPDTLRKGGMSVKFIQSSDNKYVQYRLMANTFSTTVTDWQGVDDEPTAGSENLVKSGGTELMIMNLLADSLRIENNYSLSFGQTYLRWLKLAKDVEYTFTINFSSSLTTGANLSLQNEADGGITYVQIDAGKSEGKIRYTPSEDILVKVRLYLQDSAGATAVLKVNVNTPAQETFKGVSSSFDYRELNITPVTNQYARYSDGKIMNASSSSMVEAYYIPYNILRNVTSLRMFAALSDDYAAAIAFYNDVPSEDSYIKNYSIQGERNLKGKWFEAEVPSEAKYAVLANVYYYVSHTNFKLKAVSMLKLNAVTENRNISIFARNPYTYHFNPNGFVKDGNGNNTIAGESLDDIALASRLGFKWIEANIQRTSDNHFICIHGQWVSASDQRFTTQVKSLDPNETDVTQINIHNKTLAWIKENIRYNSDYDIFKTSVPSLEEFCEECRQNGLGILAGTSDPEAVKICQRILNDDVIVYGNPVTIREFYNGWVLEWVSGNPSNYPISWVVNRCRTVGGPFIIGFESAIIDAYKENDELDELVQQIHRLGCCIGAAASYQGEDKTIECLDKGFDELGSGHQVPLFSPNYESYDTKLDISRFNIEGSVDNNIITLTTGQKVTCGNEDVIIGKGYLRIRFNGSLLFNFGSCGDIVYYTQRILTSDGSKPLVISDYFYKKNTILKIEATENTTIYNLEYFTSKC